MSSVICVRRPGAALVSAVVLGGVLGADAAAQQQIVVEPVGRASWTQMIAAEMMRPSDVIRAPRVVHKPAPFPDDIREIDPDNLDRSVLGVHDAREPGLDAPPARSSTRSLLDLSIVTDFPAVGDANTSIPPDTNGAVGPNHIVTMLNTEMGIQNRNGGSLSLVTLETFWNEGTGAEDNAFDPVTLFDTLSGRWISTVDANSFSADSKVLFAISDTDDPTGMWSFYSFEADETDATWADFPGFGVNDTWIAITNNMFGVMGGFFGSKMWVIDKSTALNGGAITVTVFDTGFDLSGNVDGFTLRPAVTYDAGQSALYIVDNSGFALAGEPLIRLSRIIGTGPSPTWEALPGIFNGLNADSGLYLVENDFNFTMLHAAQPDTEVRVSTNDTRISSAVFRNGDLWATHAGGLPGDATADRTGVFWYQWRPIFIDPLIQSGVVSGDVDSHYFFPSISVNAADDMVVGFSYADPLTYVQAAYTGRLSSDPMGTTRPPATIKSGEDSYVKSFSGSRIRWGDYTATSVDPLDDLTFWTIQQYAVTDVGEDQVDDRWGTWWAQIGGGVGCAADFNGDDLIDGADLGVLLGNWGNSGDTDLNGDGTTDGADLGILLGGWGPC